MFKPVNDSIILQRAKEESVSDSGIITGAQSKVTYTVVATNKHTEKLEGKQVYLKLEPKHLDGEYYACEYKDILAYTEK